MNVQFEDGGESAGAEVMDDAKRKSIDGRSDRFFC
jgi:hypothetical protein